MTAYAHGLKYAGAHIKSIEIDKNRALARSKGPFEHTMVISNKGRHDIDWWLHNIEGQSKPIDLGYLTTVVTTDASLEGWAVHGPNQREPARSY
jgi:hypothetical protein